MKDFFEKVLGFFETNWQIVAIAAVALLVLTIILFIMTLSRGKKLRKAKNSAAWNEKARTQKSEEEFEQLKQAVQGFKVENESLVHERKVFFEKQKQYTEKSLELEEEMEKIIDQNEKLAQRTREAEAALEICEREKNAMIAAANMAKTSAQPKVEEETVKEGIKETKPAAKAKKTQEKTKPKDKPESGQETAEGDEEVSDNESIKYTVKFDRPKNSWVVKKAGADRVTRRVDTKEEALKIARELAKKDDVVLSIHKKDGKFQKQ